MFVLIFCTTFVWNISHYKQNWVREYHQCTSARQYHQCPFISLHVQHRLLLSHFYDTRIFLTAFQKYTNIKFHKSPSSGSRVVPCRQKLIVAFRNFAKVYKNRRYKNCCCCCCSLSLHGTSSYRAAHNLKTSRVLVDRTRTSRTAWICLYPKPE